MRYVPSRHCLDEKRREQGWVVLTALFSKSKSLNIMTNLNWNRKLINGLSQGRLWCYHVWPVLLWHLFQSEISFSRAYEEEHWSDVRPCISLTGRALDGSETRWHVSKEWISGLMGLIGWEKSKIFRSEILIVGVHVIEIRFVWHEKMTRLNRCQSEVWAACALWLMPLSINICYPVYEFHNHAQMLQNCPSTEIWSW